MNTSFDFYREIRNDRHLKLAFTECRQNSVKGVVYELIYKVVSSKRTLAQNKMMWKWNFEIAKYFNETTDVTHTQDDVHDYMCSLIWPKRVNPLTNEAYRISTRRFGIKKMCKHLEYMEHWTGTKGIHLTIPPDYRLAMFGKQS